MKIARYKGHRGQLVEWEVFQDGDLFLFKWQTTGFSEIISVAQTMGWEIDYNSLPVGTIISGYPSSSKA